MALAELGFRLVATEGTAAALTAAGIAAERVAKVADGVRPHIVDRMKNGEIALVVNTPEGRASRLDSYEIRRTAIVLGIPYFTTLAAARAAVGGIRALKSGRLEVQPLQAYHTDGAGGDER
jgi:carbamoyl-phosphate synthase large subunit